ncbi:MAG: hypothetical protein Q8Q73_14815 [Stagnimonas sp.]|nr:hypothetical protein [Stagnimonas sp.]
MPLELVLFGLTVIVGLLAFIGHQIMASVRELRGGIGTLDEKVSRIVERLGIAESKVLRLDEVRETGQLDRRHIPRPRRV